MYLLDINYADGRSPDGRLFTHLPMAEKVELTLCVDFFLV